MLVEQCGVHGEQLLVAACLYDAFAGIMDHDGALLGLFVCMATNVDESLYDIVECVVVIVVDNEFASAVVEQVNVLFFLLLVLVVVFHRYSFH